MAWASRSPIACGAGGANLIVSRKSVQFPGWMTGTGKPETPGSILETGGIGGSSTFNGVTGFRSIRTGSLGSRCGVIVDKGLCTTLGNSTSSTRINCVMVANKPRVTIAAGASEVRNLLSRPRKLPVPADPPTEPDAFAPMPFPLNATMIFLRAFL
ncbi:hypothetical protein [Hyphomonas sp. CY54-11-8]|uniref:hypothetical protein n=1 Tax=Hyphomonas sp. CY54-11-8 TaxID=1280944 RepID=UPI001F1B3466|nr:hypothetical protein [Hyphomonas sp. CY54-11-8]